MYVLLATPGAEALRAAIPVLVTLVNAHDENGTTRAAPDWLAHAGYSGTLALLLGRRLLWQV